MKSEAISFIWDGRSMIPLDRYRSLASRQFRPGNVYPMIPHRDRSMKAHGLYFKAIEVAWQNLPEEWQRRRDSNLDRFPSSTHLRKWALIQEGFANRIERICKSHEDAIEWGKFIREELDPYAVLEVAGDVLVIWTAQSQDANMGHDEFQRSMDKVMGRVAHMLGISADELCDNAKASMKRIKESS